ncbi:hypothetical protein [Daejeonella lutea]|nr:hypothetical protein [Daejeonella lutea]
MEDERIIQVLEKMEANQQVIISLLREHNLALQFDPDMWKDNLVAQKILGVSKSTLLRIRDPEEFIYEQRGKRTYYYLPSIFPKVNAYLK